MKQKVSGDLEEVKEKQFHGNNHKKDGEKLYFLLRNLGEFSPPEKWKNRYYLYFIGTSAWYHYIITVWRKK
jgi:hypothetical protein